MLHAHISDQGWIPGGGYVNELGAACTWMVRGGTPNTRLEHLARRTVRQQITESRHPSYYSASDTAPRDRTNGAGNMRASIYTTCEYLEVHIAGDSLENEITYISTLDTFKTTKISLLLTHNTPAYPAHGSRP